MYSKYCTNDEKIMRKAQFLQNQEINNSSIAKLACFVLDEWFRDFTIEAHLEFEVYNILHQQE
jgi:hypothetical protein